MGAPPRLWDRMVAWKGARVLFAALLGCYVSGLCGAAAAGQGGVQGGHGGPARAAGAGPAFISGPDGLGVACMGASGSLGGGLGGRREGGWLCNNKKNMGASVRGRGAGASGIACLSMSDKHENKRRRMLRIAELRREISVDVQRLRDRVREKIVQRNSMNDEEGELGAVGAADFVSMKGSFSKQEVSKVTKEMKEKRKSKQVSTKQDATSVLGDLPKVRRTAYERRRKMGKEFKEESPGPGDVPGDVSMQDAPRSRQWGPRQMIYSPPEMRLRDALRTRYNRLTSISRSRLPPPAGSTSKDKADKRWQAGGPDVVDGTHSLYICRHADRYNPDWLTSIMSQLPPEQANMSADYPLSSLGHSQARDLAEFLAAKGVRTIISSPYLRCLETAQEVAWATGASILVEPGLSEGPEHKEGWLPDIVERYRYFSSIDVAHEPLTVEPSGEDEDAAVIPRCAKVVEELAPAIHQALRFGGVAVMTHASVAIALTAIMANGGGLPPSDVPDEGIMGEDGVVDVKARLGTVVGGSNANRTAGISDSLLRVFDNIDSARPAGAYQLQLSDEGGWESSLECLTDHLDDTLRTTPRTPAWRFTFEKAD